MPLYQLSTYMAFFLAKAEMKTEKKSFTKKKKKKQKNKQTNKKSRKQELGARHVKLTQSFPFSFMRDGQVTSHG